MIPKDLEGKGLREEVGWVHVALKVLELEITELDIFAGLEISHCEVPGFDRCHGVVRCEDAARVVAEEKDLAEDRLSVDEFEQVADEALGEDSVISC